MSLHPNIKTYELETRTFPYRDKDNRVIGADATLFTAVLSDRGGSLDCYYSQRGFTAGQTVYGYLATHTRNGRKHGQDYPSTWYATEQERNAAMEAYFCKAEQRAKATHEKALTQTFK